ncbi:Cyclic nucleotide-binding domain-containing protein [Paenibacillus sp. GP183]|nr:Cyclic nucleotide-binding domain-containing protein [Paenibacillus sp. GP183]
MRDKLLEALVRMLRSVTVADKQASVIEGLVEQEMELYWEISEQMAGLSAIQAYGEVAEVAGQIRSAVVWRIFQLLALIFDDSTIRAVYANWSEGDARQQANAMEIMDQLTKGQIRMELAKIMAMPTADMNGVRSESQLDKQLEWLNEQDDLWLRQIIRYAAYPDESDELKDHMDRIRLLRNFSLFHGLTSRELSALALKLVTVSTSRGEYIFKAQDPGNSLYLVRSGAVGIYRDEEKLGERKAGESFGQSGVLIRRVRSADAKVEEDSLFWRLDSDDFYEVMFDRSTIAIEMMKRLSRRLRSVLAQQKEQTNEAVDMTALPGAASVAAELTAKEAAAASLFIGKDHPDSLLRRVLILQKIDLFKHLSADDIVRLAQMVDEVEYETGEVICQVGDYGDMLYGIIEGTVRIHRDGDTIAYLGTGDCFGEMAIIDSGPRSADCTATTPTVLLQLNKDQVFSLCFQNIDVLRSMLQVMGDRLIGMAG